MHSVIAATTSHGIWDSDTWGLLFTYGILMPAIVTVCVVVSMVTTRGEKETDDELRGRWGRKAPPSSSDS
jgi:hypothetical protein